MLFTGCIGGHQFGVFTINFNMAKLGVWQEMTIDKYGCPQTGSDRDE